MVTQRRIAIVIAETQAYEPDQFSAFHRFRRICRQKIRQDLPKLFTQVHEFVRIFSRQCAALFWAIIDGAENGRC